MQAHKNTLTRLDLAAAVYRRVGLSHKESARLVEAFLDQILDGALSDGEVKLSSFGTFRVRRGKARMGRNPKTGAEIPITARQTLVFRASEGLKARIAESGSEEKP